jgi:hypothetical protein
MRPSTIASIGLPPLPSPPPLGGDPPPALLLAHAAVGNHDPQARTLDGRSCPRARDGPTCLLGHLQDGETALLPSLMLLLEDRRKELGCLL